MKEIRKKKQQFFIKGCKADLIIDNIKGFVKILFLAFYEENAKNKLDFATTKTTTL